MGGGGFEPPKQIAADLQSVPFGHSGIHPYGIVFHKADDRTRTDNLLITNQLLCQLSHIGILLCIYNWLKPSDSDGNRTRVTAVKGRCLNRLTMEPQYLFSYEKTPRVGLEPTTTRLTAECSTIELSRKISCFASYLRECYAFSEKSYKAKCEEILFIPSKPNTETLSLIP